MGMQNHRDKQILALYGVNSCAATHACCSGGMHNQVPRHEGVWGSGSIAPCIRNLGTKCR